MELKITSKQPANLHSLTCLCRRVYFFCQKTLIYLTLKLFFQGDHEAEQKKMWDFVCFSVTWTASL